MANKKTNNKKTKKPIEAKSSAEIGKIVSDAKNGIMPDTNGEKITESNPKKGLITYDKINQNMKDVLTNKSDWLKRSMPDKAYKYYETNQKPDRMKSSPDLFFVQLNLIRDAQNTRMGIFASSPVEWIIRGMGPDKKDRARMKLHKHVCMWAAREANMHEQIRRSLFDYSLHGMGWLEFLWNIYELTSIGTMGMISVNWMNPLFTHPDPNARRSSALDGNFILNYLSMVKEAFIEKYDGMPGPNGKQINAEKIFDEAQDPDHFDSEMNKTFSTSEKRATVVNYEYKRFRDLAYKIDNQDVRIPLREFRHAYFAGKTVISDQKSGIDDLQFYHKIPLSNEPMYDSCYSSSQFSAEKELQDLINTMLSMSIGNQAGQISAPWKAMEGSLVDESKWENAGSAFDKVLFWRYTRAMKEAGVSTSAAEPKRDRPGQFDAGWFALMQWVFNRFDAVSVKDVVKGVNQPGVKSGRHAAILNAQGMQPTIYERHKVERPLARLGMGIHHYLVKKLDGEMEIPIDDGDTEADGVLINHVMTPQEIIKIASGETGSSLEDEMEMVSVTIENDGKTERYGWKEYIEQNRMSMQDLISGATTGAFQLIKNDLKFGKFRAELSIDPQAESNKIERMARAEQVSGIMQNMGAAFSALNYTLDAHEDPNMKEVIEGVRKEVKGLRLGKKLLDIAEKAREVIKESGGDPSQLPKPIQYLLDMANEDDDSE